MLDTGYSTRRNTSRVLLVVLICLIIQACFWIQEDHTVIRPTIKPNTEWRVEQGCGYEHCGPPPVDFLVGKELKIRIEPQNDEEKNRFAMRIGFVPADKLEIQFNPSLVTVQLGDRRVFHAKGYRCFGKIWEENYRKSVSPINSPIVVDRLNCFLLFFDTSPPKIEEEFKMKIDGVIVRGQRLAIPEMTFQKGISRW